jgi:hypothetical protein
MHPVHFPQANWMLPGGAAPLPAHRNEARVVSCWRVGFRDRLRLLAGGRIWIATQGAKPAALAVQLHPPAFDAPKFD